MRGDIGDDSMKSASKGDLFNLAIYLERKHLLNAAASYIANNVGILQSFLHTVVADKHVGTGFEVGVNEESRTISRVWTFFWPIKYNQSWESWLLKSKGSDKEGGGNILPRRRRIMKVGA